MAGESDGAWEDVARRLALPEGTWPARRRFRWPGPGPRSLAFGFGVVVPVLVWGWVLWPVVGRDHRFSLVWRASFAIVLVEAACLCFWLLSRHRSARIERALSVVFFVGAAFAAGWSVFNLLTALQVLLMMPQALLFLPVTILLASPFPCVWVYGACARRAREHALRLGTRSRE